MKAGESIPSDVLDRSVTGVNLMPGTLRDQLGTEVTLLVFLRHFGCIFCRETLSDMRAMAHSDERFPKPLFFFQGSPTEGRALLKADWPEVRAISDQPAEFYTAFGVERGGLVEMFRPAVWSAKSRAESKGLHNGERSGDIWRMPGAFLAQGPEIIWAHTYRHAADHPDYELICELTEARRTEAVAAR